MFSIINGYQDIFSSSITVNTLTLNLYF